MVSVDSVACAQFFHLDRMNQWRRDHPKAHTNAAEQGKMSGIEWKALSAEQKQPYIQQALQDKQRVIQEHLRQRLSQLHVDGIESSIAASSAVPLSGEGKEASESIAKDEMKEAIAKVEAVEEEFSELSPALSSRRPSDSSVQPKTASAEPTSERRAVAVSNTPAYPRRPVSAMQMYMHDTAEQSMEEARTRGVKLLKGDAKKAARIRWEQLNEDERDVSDRQHTVAAALH